MDFRCKAKILILNIVFVALATSCNDGTEEVNNEVKTGSGIIAGEVLGEGEIIAFKGIPFAQPPVGNLRWKAPQPVLPWDGVKQCTAFGPSPMQPRPVPFMVYTPEFLIPDKPISEDCLYLNVWTGAKSINEKRPVLVWIYGGGFTSGGSAVPIYDGEAMAKKGLVFVSVNYRVGIFGFLAHPELTAESPSRSSGNYGLLDQIAALEWIQKNIEAFGGDPGNVTIAGQSAGSMSINCLVASPLAKGLFPKAIAESGSNMIRNNVMDAGGLKEAEKEGSQALDVLGGIGLSELRKMDPDTILAKVKERFGPIVDGYVLPEPVPDVFANKKANPVNLLTGWNADEGFVFGPQSREDYQKEANDKFGKDAAMFLKYYPGGSDDEIQASRLALSRDMIFGLPNYRWAVVQSKDSSTPTFVYYFSRRPPATPDYEKYKSFHTAEVAYALDNLKFLNRPWEPEDHELAKVMSSYWSNFAKNGDPNGSGLPSWPRFDSVQNKVMLLGDSVRAGVIPNKEALDFLFLQSLKK